MISNGFFGDSDEIRMGIANFPILVNFVNFIYLFSLLFFKLYRIIKILRFE